MSLRVWLPLNGDFNNQGLSNITFINSNTTINNNGKIGKCYSFNASGYLYENTFDWTNFNTSHFSLCCWYKEPSPVASGNSQIICLGTNSGWNNIKIGLLRRLSNGYPMFSIGDGTNSLKYGFTASSFTLDTWNHITVTYSNGNLKMYLNGQLDKTMTTTIVPVLDNTQHLGIGAASNGAEKLTGYLNDVRIYDHTLSAKEVAEIAKGLVLHYKLDNNGAGLPNLITKSSYQNQVWTYSNTQLSYIYNEERQKKVIKCHVDGLHVQTSTNSGPQLDLFNLTYKENTQYTLSLDFKEIRTDKHTNVYFTFLYTDNSYTAFNTSQKPFSEVQNWTHFSLTSSPNKTISRLKVSYGSGNYVLFDNFKIVEASYERDGNIPIDEIGNVVYDCSGYRNNGIINTINPIINSPRYIVSTEFSENSSSVIKVNENNWQSQGMKELTINLWAKSSVWNTRLFSCTETGGFNVEPGNSGYWKFPIHVYTNEEQTTTAYKYDSQEIRIADLSTADWVMLTFVYNASQGTKTYINGQLHHIYDNVSYGIHFNFNVKLFLGCEAGGNGNPTSPYFNGCINDFRIYTTVLSAAAIAELYSQGQKED